MPGEQQLSLKAGILEGLIQEFRRDQAVIYIGEDVGAAGGVFGQTKGLFEEFGAERVIDTPISESAIMGLCTGAAMTGMRPVFEVMFGDFITMVMDQLVNQAAKVHYMSAGGFNCPLVLRTAVGVGGNLGPQHSQSFHVWVSHVPGLKVVMPCTAADAKGLMASAIRDNGPVIFFEDRMTYNRKGSVPEGEYLVPLGQADIKRHGSDISIITLSRMVYLALEAADLLEERGISAEVVDLRSLVPLDIKTIVSSVKKTSRALVVDAGVELFGVTGEIAASIGELAFDYLDGPVMRLGALSVPVPANKILELLVVPNTTQIVEKVMKMVGSNV